MYFLHVLIYIECMYTVVAEENAFKKLFMVSFVVHDNNMVFHTYLLWFSFFFIVYFLNRMTLDSHGVSSFILFYRLCIKYRFLIVRTTFRAFSIKTIFPLQMNLCSIYKFSSLLYFLSDL